MEIMEVWRPLSVETHGTGLPPKPQDRFWEKECLQNQDHLQNQDLLQNQDFHGIRTASRTRITTRTRAYSKTRTTYETRSPGWPHGPERLLQDHNYLLDQHCLVTDCV